LDGDPVLQVLQEAAHEPHVNESESAMGSLVDVVLRIRIRSEFGATL